MFFNNRERSRLTVQGMNFQPGETVMARIHTEDPLAPQTVYAAAFGGVFKTVDGGVTWTPVNNGLPSGAYARSVALNPIAPQEVYVGLYCSGVYKTTDGGETWAPTGAALGDKDVRALAIALETQAPVVYAGTAGGYGVYRTMNGGYTWEQASAGLPAYKKTC